MLRGTATIKKIDSINAKTLNSGSVPGVRYRARKISPEEVRAYKRIHRKGVYKKRTLKLGIFITSFLILSATSYLFFNYDSLKNQVGFNEKENMQEFADQKADMAEQSVAGTTSPKKSGYQFVATPNRLEIPRLNVIGNIIYPQKESDIESNLDSGIVHMPQSVKPGEGGNTLFTAHSSSVRAGYYSNIFSTLNKIEEGDLIFIYQNSSIFIYRVYDKEVIKPRLEYLKKSNKETLTLITCWPLGTDEKRLVVYAERLQ